MSIKAQETTVDALGDRKSPTQVDMIELRDATPGLSTRFDELERQETWRHALQNNPKAIAWCCYMLFTIVSWGYDGLCSGIVIALPQFREDYGYLYEGEYVVPAKWQLAFTAASLIGLIIGGIPATIIAKKWGRRPCLWFGYSLTLTGVFLQWYSIGNLPMFFGSKLVTGLPLGMFITIVPTYCAEIAPLALRGTMTAATNWCIVLGQVIGYGVLRQTETIPTSMAYRILFAVQWGFAAVAVVFLPFLPESPYFYILTNQPEKAKQNARRLRRDGFNIDGWMASIYNTIDETNSVKSEASFAMCFQGTNRIRTMAAVIGFFIQQNSGVSWVLGYMGYFMELAGVSTSVTFNVTFGLTGVMLVGNTASWFLIEMVGRRTVAVYGTAVLSVSLLLIGILSVIPTSNAIWAQVAFMAVWSFVYQATIGSVAWTILSEVSTSSLRSHTQAIATLAQGVAGTAWSFALPYLVNPNEANLGGKIGFIYGGILGVLAVISFFIIPDTKGRSFADIDALFEAKVPIRQFTSVNLTALPAEKDV